LIPALLPLLGLNRFTVGLVFSTVVVLVVMLRVGTSPMGAAAEALERIAAANPAPELRELLPELRSLAGDWLFHPRRSREAARSAYRRIEDLTAEARDLPRPAEPSTAAALPPPGAAPVLEGERLPVPDAVPSGGAPAP
jgi:hypothetical protein